MKDLALAKKELETVKVEQAQKQKLIAEYQAKLNIVDG